MAWIESHQELGRHPKTRRLARMLGISLPAAVGHLHYIWWWAMDYADDGDLSAYDPEDIAEAGLWEGDPDQFVQALLECGPGNQWGFLERTEDGRLVLHDWLEYAGGLLEVRAQRAKDGARGNHERWHVKRGVFKSDCPFCLQEKQQAESGASPPDRPPSSQRSHPESSPDRKSSHQTKPNQNQTYGGGIYDDALGTREEMASNDARSDADRSGFQPATATDVMIADDSITPAAFFERLWGVYPPTIDDLLSSYEDKLHPSAVKWAIWEARLAGQRRASYLRAILDRLVAQGLTTAAAAQAYEERRQRERDRPPKAARTAASMDGAPNAGAYREIDRETVERYAALIYAAGEAAVADDADAGAATAPDKPP